MAANTVVQTRIDGAVRDEAAAVLKTMGLTVSDAVRMVLAHIARDKALPSDLCIPNAATTEAMEELERGEGRRSHSVEELMADLNADD